jgi:hypothetical protein
VIGAKQEGAVVRLFVADDGPGLPEGFDVETSEGMGLSLIRTLVRADLRGAFRLRRGALPASAQAQPALEQVGAATTPPGEAAQPASARAAQPPQWTIAEIQFALTGAPVPTWQEGSSEQDAL